MSQSACKDPKCKKNSESKSLLHLVSPGGGLPGGLLEASDGVVETWSTTFLILLPKKNREIFTICLALQRLHLLPDGIHVGRFSFSSWKRDFNALIKETLTTFSKMRRIPVRSELCG